MDWVDIAIIIAGIGLVAWLLHAADVIGQNPYQRLKAHEDLIGARLPENLSMEEKQMLLDRRGLAPRSAARTAYRIAVVAAGAAILLWWRR